jgi:ethanolamine utilization microcompartment shell protein EutL
MLVKTQKALNAGASNGPSELAGESIISVTPYPGNTLGERERLVNEALAEF